MGENEVGRCECCGKKDVSLTRTYFRYPFKCECHSPQHFILVRHCEDCKPKEPKETKIILKTEDLKNPYEFAFKIIQKEMRKTRNIKGEMYYAWESNLAMMIYDSVSNITIDKANKIASNWLDYLFGIGEYA